MTDKSDPLQAARRAQAKAAHERAQQALRALIREGHPLTFAAVAQRAQVSRRYLYSQPDLAERIRTHRHQPARTPAVATPTTDPIINALRDQLRRTEEAHRSDKARLQQQVVELTQRNAALLGLLISHGIHAD